MRTARPRQVGRLAAIAVAVCCEHVSDREVEAVVAQQAGQPRRRGRQVGGHDDAVALGEQLLQAFGQAAAVADDRRPRRGRDGRRLRRFGRGDDRPARAARLTVTLEQAVGVGVQAGERPLGVAGPAGGEGAGQVVLLGEQVGRPVAHAAGLDQHDLGPFRQEAGEQPVALGQPRQPALHAVEQVALGEALPVLATPRLLGDQSLGAGPHRVVEHELTGGEDLDGVEARGRALVADAELGQAVDLVAPQVDAHRRVGGGREDVDDGAAAGDLPAMFDELLAAVALVHEAGHQLVGIERGAGADRHRGDRLLGRGQALEQGPHAGDDHGRHAIRVAEAVQDAHAPTHRLDARADPLERQGLPGGEQLDVAAVEELRQVVGELAGHGAGRAGHDQRPPAGGVHQPGDRQRAGRLRHGEHRVGAPEHRREGRFVTQQLGERRQVHGTSRVYRAG